MPIPILQTKLFTPPPGANWVLRSNLIQRLDQATQTSVRLILVSAQAGSGKSTLLGSWLSAREQPAAWLSLDAQDNDPVRFWTYVLAALRTLHPALAQTVWQEFQSPTPPASLSIESMQTILIDLLNEIAALPDRLVLVLDDYHVINNYAIHDALAFTLDHLSDSLRLVIASRADPPLPIGRLRVRDQLLELRAADLRFTPDEAAIFLNERMGLNLTRDDVAALDARTEGWIAGLQLAALSMQGRRDTREFIQAFTGSHRFVLDYLAEEVLNRQTPEVQTFLLHTSILDQLCGPLCDAVVDRADSQTVLESLDKSNLFLIALDDARQWSRYHHLFGDLLRARLRQQQPALLPVLHRRAAEWFERQGLAVEAMQHALAANDVELAADLIERHATILMTRGEMGTLLRWLKQLPAEVTQRRPWLFIWQGWIYAFAGNVELVEPLAQRAEQLMRDQPPSEESGLRSAQNALGNLASMRSFVAQIAGEEERAIELAHEADRLLAPNDYIARSLIPYTLGRGYRAQGEMIKSTAYFEELVNIGRSAGIWTLSVAFYELAISCKLRGELNRAHALYQAAIQQLIDYKARTMGAAASVDVGLSDLLREWNNLDQARVLAREAVEHMRPWSNPLSLVAGYTNLVRVLEACGDFDGAWAAWREGDRVRQQFAMMPVLSSNLDMFGVRLWLATGQLSEAEQWVERWLKQTADQRALLTRELEAIHAGHVLLALDRPRDAILVLTPYLEDASRQQRHGRLLQSLAVAALAQRALGQNAAAMATLERALRLAEPENYTRLFLDGGEAMQLLISDFRLLIEKRSHSTESHNHLSNYLDRLLAGFPVPTRPLEATPINNQQHLHRAADAVQVSAFSNLLEPLSDRELEVLRLLAAGLSNSQIADRLVVAVGTIKTHVHNIYGKLGAQNRAQAVTKATELHLL